MSAGPALQQIELGPDAHAVVSCYNAYKGKGSAQGLGLDDIAFLNDAYNLGVPLDDASLVSADTDHGHAPSPPWARPDFHGRRHRRIVHLATLHARHGTGHVQTLLCDFDAKAREQMSGWVRKPRADPDLLPRRRSAVPRAANAADQLLLQCILLDVFEQAQEQLASPPDSHQAPAMELASPTPFTVVSAGAGAATAAATATTASATLLASLDTADDSGTQPASPGFSSGMLSALRLANVSPADRWLTNHHHHATPPAQQEASPPPSRSISPASSAMFSALDSFEDPFASQNTDYATNATADGSDCGSPLPAGLQRSYSQDSFPISEDYLEAFNMSFDQLDPPQSAASSLSSSPPSIHPPHPGSPTVTGLAALNLDDDLTCGADESLGLARRLHSVFPTTPSWLRHAPFPIVWETTRMALQSGVDLNTISMDYSPAWIDQDCFYRAIRRHPNFAHADLLDRSSPLAWDIALGRAAPQGDKRTVVYAAALSYNLRPSGPLYFVKLQPLELELPHRLSRQFGADRFLELLFPSHNSSAGLVPPHLRDNNAATQQVNRWLACRQHRLCGRNWAAFYAKDEKTKRPVKADDFSSASRYQPTVSTKKIYLFAEDASAASAASASTLDTAPANGRTPMRVYDLLDWQLQFNKHPVNCDQPYLKLFARIALGLSRTTPTLVFEPSQIIHNSHDITSQPGGNVMNDGIGRMSLSVARKLRTELGLGDLPTAVQGRLGSAKGMWILDTTDPGLEDWIETYPSQRKWKCDWLDPAHRTLEVKCCAGEVRLARLNLQFLPILEDRADDKARMRAVVGSILATSVRNDVESLQQALDHPLKLSAWAYENAKYQTDRLSHGGQVRFLGGLPDRSEDTIQFLLNGGFDPRKQQLLFDLIYDMQQKKCERLLDKLNVQVGRSAYLYMVVDFLGVLEEGEVQVCFSSKVQVDADGPADETGDDGSFSDTMLADLDILVARSPAHFPSDMQKVHAVFRKELSALKDVIVFPRKGSTALADKLSGGDYDGDRAWVCWDPRIVGNFSNAQGVQKHDLLKMGYLKKEKTTLSELIAQSASGTADGGTADGGGRDRAWRAAADKKVPRRALAEMLEKSFEFSMRDSLLGKMTSYKESWCYTRGSIGDVTAEIFSSLLSDLVDQAKQGITFTRHDFNRLRTEQLETNGGTTSLQTAPIRFGNPAYKARFRGAVPSLADRSNFIDHLKFDIAVRIICDELKAVDTARKTKGGGASRGKDSGGDDGVCQYWDLDLSEPARRFEALAQKSPVLQAVFDGLQSDLRALASAWELGVASWKSKQAVDSNGNGNGADDNSESYMDVSYPQRVLQLYNRWCGIVPQLAWQKDNGDGSKATTATATATEMDTVVQALLKQDYVASEGYSQWAWIRASQMFRMFYRKRPKMVWQLGGRQLQEIKASMAKIGSSGGVASVGSGGAAGGDAPASDEFGTYGGRVMMTAQHGAAHRPDAKLIKKMMARQYDAAELDNGFFGEENGDEVYDW